MCRYHYLRMSRIAPCTPPPDPKFLPPGPRPDPDPCRLLGFCSSARRSYFYRSSGVCNWRYGATCSSSLTVEASRHIFPAPMLSRGRAQRLGWLQLRQNPDRCSYNYNTCARKIVILFSRSCPETDRVEYMYIASPRRWRRTMARPYV